ncbi:unnamed protein product, partial [Ixodes hexagonus]
MARDGVGEIPTGISHPTIPTSPLTETACALSERAARLQLRGNVHLSVSRRTTREKPLHFEVERAPTFISRISQPQPSFNIARSAALVERGRAASPLIRRRRTQRRRPPNGSRTAAPFGKEE